MGDASKIYSFIYLICDIYKYKYKYYMSYIRIFNLKIIIVNDEVAINLCYFLLLDSNLFYSKL